MLLPMLLPLPTLLLLPTSLPLPLPTPDAEAEAVERTTKSEPPEPPGRPLREPWRGCRRGHRWRHGLWWSSPLA